MRRNFAIGIAFLLGVGLAACSSNDDKDPQTEICNNDRDDDGDGDIDCADADCSAVPTCQNPTETNCSDGQDNDGDGDTDCDDSDCVGTPTCEQTPEANCTDGLDNDSDGDTDCADSDCAGEASCETTETTCDDDFDNDGDGDVDCDDTDCIGTSACTSLPETNCTDGLDNDSDGDTDCADSDCEEELDCEYPEVTCNDGFDNDGDGDTDCDDSECASDAACLATNGVGGPCLVDADCDDTDAFCMEEDVAGMPGGYCTVAFCDNSTAPCPTGATCIDIGGGVTMCVQTCTSGGTDCRDAYECADVGTLFCWPNCTSHTQCSVTGQCDTQSGYCAWGELEVSDVAITGDGNSNGIADPGETFSLAFNAMNVGSGTAAGPISVTLAVDTTTTTVTGTVTLTPPGSTVCSATDLDAYQAAACSPWTVQIPGSAQPDERLDLTVTFTNGTDTWVDVISLTIGSPYASLLSAPDPSGDSGSFACDLQDVQGYVDSGTMYLRLVFHAACTIEGGYDIWLTDTTDYITLSLEDVGGTMTPRLWNYNGGNWQPLTVPGSYSVTPTSGSSDTLSYQIDIADIPVVDTTGSMLYLWAAIIGPSSSSYDDDAPDSGTGEIYW